MSSGRRSSSSRSVSWVAAAGVAVAAPLLARLDLQRLQRWLEPAARRSPRAFPVDPGREIEAVGRWVDRLIRWGKPLVRPGCLTRGITGYYLLRRVGLDVSLCFGMGPVRGVGTTGHCWLILEGKPVLEVSDPRSAYTEMVRLSSRGLTSASPVS